MNFYCSVWNNAMLLVFQTYQKQQQQQQRQQCSTTMAFTPTHFQLKEIYALNPVCVCEKEENRYALWRNGDVSKCWVSSYFDEILLFEQKPRKIKKS